MLLYNADYIFKYNNSLKDKQLLAWPLQLNYNLAGEAPYLCPVIEHALRDILSFL